MEKKCIVCGKNNRLKVNAYNEMLCEDCWDEYINSDRGLVEYFFQILTKDANVKDFDADFLTEVIDSWRAYAKQSNLSEIEKLALEFLAEEAGLL